MSRGAGHGPTVNNRLAAVGWAGEGGVAQQPAFEGGGRPGPFQRACPVLKLTGLTSKRLRARGGCLAGGRL